MTCFLATIAPCQHFADATKQQSEAAPNREGITDNFSEVMEWKWGRWWGSWHLQEHKDYLRTYWLRADGHFFSAEHYSETRVAAVLPNPNLYVPERWPRPVLIDAVPRTFFPLKTTRNVITMNLRLS
jgi:hypothetical protein